MELMSIGKFAKIIGRNVKAKQLIDEALDCDNSDKNTIKTN